MGHVYEIDTNVEYANSSKSRTRDTLTMENLTYEAYISHAYEIDANMEHANALKSRTHGYTMRY